MHTWHNCQYSYRRKKPGGKISKNWTGSGESAGPPKYPEFLPHLLSSNHTNNWRVYWRTIQFLLVSVLSFFFSVNGLIFIKLISQLPLTGSFSWLKWRGLLELRHQTEEDAEHRLLMEAPMKGVETSAQEILCRAVGSKNYNEISEWSKGTSGILLSPLPILHS